MNELPCYTPYIECASSRLLDLKGYDWSADLSTLTMETNILTRRILDAISVPSSVQKTKAINLRFSVPLYKEGWPIRSQPIYGKILGLATSKDFLRDAVNANMIDKVSYAVLNRLYVDLLSDISKSGYSAGYFTPLPWIIKGSNVIPKDIAVKVAQNFVDSAKNLDDELYSSILGVEVPIDIGAGGILDSTTKAMELGKEVRKILNTVSEVMPQGKGEIALRFGINYSHLRSGKEANLAAFIVGLHEESGLEASYHQIPPQFTPLTAALGQRYVSPVPSNSPVMIKFGGGSGKHSSTHKPFLGSRTLRFEALEKDPSSGLRSPAHNCAYCHHVKTHPVIETFVNEEYKRGHFHAVMLEQVALIRQAKKEGQDMVEALKSIYSQSGYKNIIEPVIKNLNAGYW